jgi:exodeoxyribonuclease V alpha subunit
VLHDLIESGVVPVVRLTEAFRQAANSRIITNAHRIRQGQTPEMSEADSNSDFHFVEREDSEKIAATLVKLVKERIPQRFALDPIRDVQVLCPMNRGSLGVRELNNALQQVLNPIRTGKPASSGLDGGSRAATKLSRPRTTTTRTCSMATSTDRININGCPVNTA